MTKRSTRVHLGCGKKLLPGYVNCDVAPSGSADVLFTLLDRYGRSRTTPRARSWLSTSGSTSTSWDHPHIAAEILRILKPGGHLVLEMPDLFKSCRNLLNGETEQNSYWGIYADPSYKDPYQMHKSGWWPDKISKFLREAGFKRVVCGDPQHKGKRVIRDFRTEAWK